MQRTALVERSTKETQVRLELDIDGTGRIELDSGIGFLDHMLEIWSYHAGMNLIVHAKGDRHIDDHHTVEDVGICLGQSLSRALGDRAAIGRFGWATLPMDDALVTVAVDVSGRAFFDWRVPFLTEKIGAFDVQLIAEFWRAFSQHAALNFHALLHHGENSHHIAESVFKAAARAMRMACQPDPLGRNEPPSTKGRLTGAS